jgi:tetratricopeptide (TPR) repeat protein
MNFPILVPLIGVSVLFAFSPNSIAGVIIENKTFEPENPGSTLKDQMFSAPLGLPRKNELTLTSRKDIPKHIWIADQYLKEGKFDTVIIICEQILKMEHNHIDALAYTAAAYKGLGKENLFKQHARLINKLAPESATFYLALGQTYKVLKNNISAENTYKDGLKTSPESTSLLLALANLYKETGRINDAYDKYQKALKKKKLPTKYFIQANFAICQIDQQEKKFDRVIKRAKMITDLYPPIPQGYLFWASAHLARGEPHLAIKAYEKLMKANPDSPVSYQELALVYNDKLNDEKNALRYARQGISKFPSDSKSYDILGWIHFQNKRYSEAIKQFQKAVSLTQDNPQYLYHLGLSYLQKGDRASANDVLHKALSNIDQIKFKEFADEIKKHLK